MVLLGAVLKVERLVDTQGKSGISASNFICRDGVASLAKTSRYEGEKQRRKKRGAQGGRGTEAPTANVVSRDRRPSSRTTKA